MKYDLSIYELGNLLRKVSNTYKVYILTKINLSGGWMTLQGEMEIEATPTKASMIKGNNVISLRLKNSGEGEPPIKIIGAKDGKFNVTIEPKKVVEIHTAGLGLQVEKKRQDESTIKIDDSIVLTVNAGVDTIDDIIKLV